MLRFRTGPRVSMMATGRSREYTTIDQEAGMLRPACGPSEYVLKILDDLNIGDSELRGRVESHLVPYRDLKSKRGTLQQRYKRFLLNRAELLAKRIEELTTLP